MLGYRKLNLEEADRIAEIDATHFIKHAWRMNEEIGEYGAEKLFLCAGSAENTIAFYHKLGCVVAAEKNEKLYEEDPRDIQLEYSLCCQ